MSGTEGSVERMQAISNATKDLYQWNVEGGRGPRFVLHDTDYGMIVKRVLTSMDRPERDDKYQPGSYGCHEALHTISVLLDLLARHVLDHPAVAGVPAWEAMAHESADQLWNLYQAIGAAHLDQD